MRRRLADLESAEVRRAPTESVRNVRQNHPSVDCCRSRLESEVERFGFVDFLDRRNVLSIEPRHVHEHVVVDEDAVLVLMGRATVLLKCLELARLQARWGSVTALVDTPATTLRSARVWSRTRTSPAQQGRVVSDRCPRRRVPAEGIRRARIEPEAVVIRRG